MQKRRCYLCGGKLVNGVCVECGLDNKRNDRKSFRLNSTTAEFAKDRNTRNTINTTTQKEEKIKNQEFLKEKNQNKEHKTAYVLQSQPNKRKDVNKQVRKKTKSAVEGKKKTTFSKMIKIIVSIILGLTFIPFIIGWVIDGVSELGKELTHENYLEQEYNIYENVTYDLSNEGDVFEIELSPGNYKIGAHIPEGIYLLERTEGTGDCKVKDQKNNIYADWWLSNIEERLKDGAVQSAEDVRLYEGGYFIVDEGVKVRLTSECAQVGKLIPLIENPISEEQHVKEGEEYTAGVDFPAGIYDFRCEKNYAWIDVTYEEDSDIYGVFKEDEGGYKNIYFPEGTVVSGGGGSGVLVPADMIESEDYTSYYENTKY